MKKIENIQKHNPFKIPEKYFEKLPEIISDKIRKTKKRKKSFPIMKYAVAASLISIITATIIIKIFVNNNIQESQDSHLTDNINIENYIDENTIVNEYAEDSTIVESENQTSDERNNNDEIDYLAETIDYNSLLAEL